MDESLTMGLKDVIYIAGGLTTVLGSYFAIKYQGLTNAKDIAFVAASNDEQWVKIDAQKEELSQIKERIVQAISMETAENKFVSKELFELKISQFDADIKQTKAISQSTLDAVQTLTMNLVKEH